MSKSAFDLLLEFKGKTCKMEENFIKAVDRGNKTAGIRARKLLIEMSEDCRNIRQRMLEEFNSGKYKKGE